MEAERSAAHSWAQRLGCDDCILDRRRGRKDAGKKRVQRAAIIRVVAGASVRTSVVTMAIGSMPIGTVSAGLVVSSMRDGGGSRRVSWLKRRRDDAGKLGDQKQADQKANRACLCPEPLHQCAELIS